MKLVITYLVVMLALIALSFLGLEQFGLPESLASSELALRCALISMLGGILYCLRSVYLNRCVHDRWTKSWRFGTT